METKKSSIYSGNHVTVIVMTCEMTSDNIQHYGTLQSDCSVSLYDHDLLMECRDTTADWSAPQAILMVLHMLLSHVIESRLFLAPLTTRKMHG